MKRFKCCFCGMIYEGFGHNPWPVDKSDGARCCDDCDSEIVIPARIVALFARDRKGGEDGVRSKNG